MTRRRRIRLSALLGAALCLLAALPVAGQTAMREKVYEKLSKAQEAAEAEAEPGEGAASLGQLPKDELARLIRELDKQFDLNIAGLMFDAIEKRLRVSKSGT